MEIRNRYTDEVIFKSKHKTMKETVVCAVKQGANLWSADLQRADLREADLQEANLQGADLRGADLCNANFHKAKISYRGKTIEIQFKEVS